MAPRARRNCPSSPKTVRNGGEHHCLVGKNLVPVAKRTVGRDRQRAALVAHGDQLEQDAGLRLILGDVGDVVEDQQVIFVELGDGRLESELAVGDLELLNELPGANEEDAPSLLDEAVPDAGRKVRFAGAASAEE